MNTDLVCWRINSKLHQYGYKNFKEALEVYVVKNVLRSLYDNEDFYRQFYTMKIFLNSS